MATIKLYETNSYLTKMTATVLRCQPYKEGYATVFDQTVFYPEGGGQPSDRGVLDGKQVLYVYIREDIVYHVTKEPLVVGAVVEGEINWARRFDFMQQHTGEHITTGQAFQLFGANNIGFHLSENSVMLDVDKELTDDAIGAIEEAANRAIYENASISARTPSPDELERMNFRSKPERLHSGEAIRIVEVKGYDCCACCGTHLSFAGQVGIIKILDHFKHKGGTRIVMVAGRRALDDYRMRQHQVDSTSALLSAKPHEIAKSVERLLTEQEQLKSQLSSLKSDFIALKLKDIPVTSKLAFYEEPNLSPDTLRRMTLALMKRTAGVSAVFSLDSTNIYKYAFGSPTMDMRELGKAFNHAFHGRGGGSAELIQGTVNASLDEIKQFLEIL